MATKQSDSNNTNCNRRLTSGDICNKPSINPKNILFTVIKPRCNTCDNKCDFVDHNKNMCEQDKYHLDLYCGRLCFNHYKQRLEKNIKQYNKWKSPAEQLQNIKQYNKWKSAAELHKTHEYVGSHNDEYQGETCEIYHYILKSKLSNIDDLDKYDREIWPHDNIYYYCGNAWNYRKDEFK
jgi:hypothetical protein